MSAESADPTAALYEQHLARNYGAPPVTLVRGEGCRVWDAAGKPYLDFASGIAVNALGHAHPVWVQRVSAQAAKLVHLQPLKRRRPSRLALKRSQSASPSRLAKRVAYSAPSRPPMSLQLSLPLVFQRSTSARLSLVLQFA